MELPLFSHYPSHPPPISLELTTTPPETCSYLPDRQSQTRAFWTSRMPGDVYHQFMNAGFRRSGRVFYQPVCAGCRKCVPIRVPVAKFSPSKSQRRSLKPNADLVVDIQIPKSTPEKFDLYSKYRREWHHSETVHTPADFESFLYASVTETIEFSYRDQAGKLVGVGLCDICPQSLSSVYFYSDPAEARRSLGTFSALFEIAFAADRGIPHYYLGYWVSGCRTMDYKAHFKPHEILMTDGTWGAVL